MSEDRRRGPVEAHPWPPRLRARVASPDGRVHGYDVVEDLARHYSFAEQAYLSLTGSLPDAAEARAFEWALSILSETSVAEAPVHCAVVVRLCGASPGAAYAAGLTALTEQATDLVRRHESLFDWLDGRAPFPPEHAARSLSDRRALEEARRALGALSIDALDEPLSAEATALAVLHRAGIRAPAAIIAVVTMARLPVLAAETAAQPPLAFRDYPMDLPDFVLDEPSEEP